MMSMITMKKKKAMIMMAKEFEVVWNNLDDEEQQFLVSIPLDVDSIQMYRWNYACHHCHCYHQCFDSYSNSILNLKIIQSKSIVVEIDPKQSVSNTILFAAVALGEDDSSSMMSITMMLLVPLTMIMLTTTTRWWLWLMAKLSNRYACGWSFSRWRKWRKKNYSIRILWFDHWDSLLIESIQLSY